MTHISLIPSPCYVLEEHKLKSNLQQIKEVADRSGVEIILAFKGFAMWSSFPLVKEYVNGATASSLHEAMLCFNEMKTKAHTYCVAYRDEEFEEILKYSSYITFNSISQYDRFIDRVPSDIKVGLRVNPEWSDVETDLYNPASSTSRLGITGSIFPDTLPSRVTGLHLHVLCESEAESLGEVISALKSKFGKHLHQLEWINFGGGHLMTRKGYNKDHLVHLLTSFREEHNCQIILEPGSAFAWEAGFLRSTVLDIVENGRVKTAVLDVSFTCHMPDCLEMPYKPHIRGASQENSPEHFAYQIGGLSCLAGDFISEYWFPEELKVGDTIIFEDMIHYTMVKTTTFNGIEHPSIGILRENGFELVRSFGFEDYRDRLS